MRKFNRIYKYNKNNIANQSKLNRLYRKNQNRNQSNNNNSKK